MSRWLVIAFLLSPACATSPAPPDGDEIVSKTADPPADPDPLDDPDPPADPGDTLHDPSDAPHVDCEALWEIAEELGCAIAKFVCAAAEDFPVGGSLVPCDVAVPIACGLASATAEAAAALCP